MNRALVSKLCVCVCVCVCVCACVGCVCVCVCVDFIHYGSKKITSVNGQCIHDQPTNPWNEAAFMGVDADA